MGTKGPADHALVGCPRQCAAGTSIGDALNPHPARSRFAWGWAQHEEMRTMNTRYALAQAAADRLTAMNLHDRVLRYWDGDTPEFERERQKDREFLAAIREAIAARQSEKG